MKPETEWEVIGLRAKGGETKSVVAVTVGKEVYIFRYAYDARETAEAVMGRLRDNFGRPCGIETDLGTNYWLLDTRQDAYRFARMTTMKANWHVLPADAPRKVSEQRAKLEVPPVAGDVK